MARKRKLQEKTMAILMATVNGVTSMTPVVMPLSDVARDIPSQLEGTLEKKMATSFNRGGQVFDRLFFTSAYAASVVTVNDGDSYVITNGDTVTGTIISGGTMNVHGGANAYDTTMYGGLQMVVGTATNTNISGGEQECQAGGWANNTYIYSGGGQYLYDSGTTATNTYIYAGGEQQVQMGAHTSITYIRGGEQYLYSGTLATDTQVETGTQYVTYGAAASTATVYSGGIQNVYSGGRTENTVLSGGIQNVSGSASGTRIVSGTQYVLPSGSATGTTINGGTQVIASRGSAISTTINGGTQSVYGVASNTSVGSGGTQSVNSGGSASNATIFAGGRQDISAGGIASGTYISGISTSNGYLNGNQAVLSGGIAENTTISGGLQAVLGNANSTTILNGGSQGVLLTGVASVTFVSAGGLQAVYSYGKAISTSILTGGYQAVSGNGSATGTMISAGGFQYVQSGGSVSDTTVSSGGFQLVSAGGSASVTKVNSGGYQIVSAGGSAAGTTVSSGGNLQMQGSVGSSGEIIETGSVTNTSTGSTATIPAAIVTGATLQDGYVFRGTTDVTLSANSGGVTITSGQANNITLNSGGVYDGQEYSGLLVVLAGNSASATTVNNRGVLDVYGSASSTTVNSGGTENVYNGGSAGGTLVNVSGTQNVNRGGTAENAVLTGQQNVWGLASSTIVNDGGTQNINSGGQATSTTVNTSGTQNVNSGGTAEYTVLTGQQNVWGLASSTTVNNGGTQSINSGGRATSTMVNTNGTQNVNSGGTAEYTVLTGQQNVWGLANSTTVNNGGVQVVFIGGTVSGTQINDGAQYVSGGNAAGTTLNNGGTMVFLAGTAGDVTANSGSVVQMTSGLTLSGTTSLNQGTIDLGRFSGLYTISNLVATSGSTLYLANSGTVGNRLALGTLSGVATFVLSTDLAQGQSDTIQVSGIASGDYQLVITNYGGIPQLHQVVRVVDLQDEVQNLATFHGGGDSGAYYYNVEKGSEISSISGLVSEDYYYYAAGPSAASRAAIGENTDTIVVWYGEMNDIKKRMGELRLGTQSSDDFWVRTYANKYNVKPAGSDAYRQILRGIEIGKDNPQSFAGGKKYTGFVLGTGKADDTFDGGSGTTSSNYVGAYASWLHDNGTYFDLIGKYNWFRHDFTTASDSGKYDNKGMGLSAEIGRRYERTGGFFFEPSAEVSALWAGKAAYATANNLAVDTPSSRSLQLRLGLTAGRSWKGSDGAHRQFYGKVSWVNEYEGDGTVTVNTVPFESSIKGHQWVTGIGFVEDTGNRQIYASIERSWGKSISKDWGFDAGYRWKF